MKGRLLWAVAVLLGLGVVGEWIWLAPDGALPTVAAPLPATGRAAAGAEPVGQWIAAILARPLLSPDRRPAKVAAAAPRAPSGPNEPPRLTGILVTPEGGHAIFAGDGDHSTIVSEGALVAGWQVVAIRPGEVQLAGPGGARTVRPSYSTAAAPAAAAPAGFPAAFNAMVPGAQVTPSGPFLGLQFPAPTLLGQPQR